MLKRIIFFIFICFVFPYNKTNALNYFSRAAGNWNNPATWSNTGFGGAASLSYPGQLGAGDVVLISGYAVTANVTPAFAVTSIAISQSNNTGNDTRLDVNTAGIILTCTGLSITENNLAKNVELNVASTSTLQINGNVTISRNGANNTTFRERIYVSGTGRMNVTGNLTYTYLRAAGAEAENEIWIDNNGRLDVNGTLTIVHGSNAGSGNRFNFVMDNAAICNIGIMSITLTNSNDGDLMFFNLNGGTLTVTGAWQQTITNTCTGVCSISVYLDGGTLHCLNTVNCNQNPFGGSGNLSFFVNQNSTLNPSSLILDGKVAFTKTNGNNMEIENNANGTITLGDSLTMDLNNGSSGDAMIIDLNGGTMTVTKGLRISLFGSTTANGDLQIDGGTLSVGSIAFYQNNTGAGGLMNIYLNNNSTVNPASLTVGASGIFFSDNGGANMDVIVNGNSTLTVNGDLRFDNNLGNANDRNEIRMNVGVPTPVVNITGNITTNLNVGSTGDEELFDINSGTFTCNGNMTLNTNVGAVFSAKSSIEVDGNSTQFIIGGALTFNHVGGPGVSDRIYVGTNVGSPVVTLGSLLFNNQNATSGITLRQASSSIVTINGNFTLTSTVAGQVLIDLQSFSILQLKGSFIRSATPNRFGILNSGANATIKYIGTANTQTIAGDAGSGGDGFVYSNVELNNTFGAVPSLFTTATEGDASITSGGNLTTTSGIVSSVAAGMLVIKNAGTSGVGNANCYINGPMKKIGGNPNSFIFPVGSYTIGWARLEMSNYNNNDPTTEFICTHYSAPSPNNTAAFMGTAYGAALNYVSYNEYWDLDRFFDIGNNATCHVRLYWESQVNSGITNAADLMVGHYEASGTNMWENQGQGSISFGASGSIKSATILNNFSPVTFGSQDGVNPLPIELLYFNANLNKDKVDLDWATANEKNNDYFTVEKSIDAINFKEVLTKKALGNSNTKINYSSSDLQPFTGTSYYRLKQTDFDKSFSYSNIVSVLLVKNLFAFKIYPNPNEGEFRIDISGMENNHEVFVNLKDANGREVFSSSFFTNNQNENKFEIIPKTKISAGTYFCALTIEGVVYNVKVVVN